MGLLLAGRCCSLLSSTARSCMQSRHCRPGIAAAVWLCCSCLGTPLQTPQLISRLPLQLCPHAVHLLRLLPAPPAACCSCKFGHPLDKAPKVQFNSLGLPLRPEEPECAFYMRNYRWAAGRSNWAASDCGMLRGCAEVLLHAWACVECGPRSNGGVAACQVVLAPNCS